MKNFESPILLYDGTCGLCNGTVLFILKHERVSVLKFTSQQSPLGEVVMEQFGLDATIQQSLVLIENQRSYQKSEAAIRTAILMGGFWRYTRFFRWIPLIIRDTIYDWIAKNRYAIFGKSQDCAFLPHVDKKRFL